MRQNMKSFIWGVERGKGKVLFLHKNPGLSVWGMWGHLQPLQSPQGAQPETPVVWPLPPGPRLCPFLFSLQYK